MSILVYIEQLQGAAKQISWEIMGKGREFADRLGKPLVGLVVGDKAGAVAKEAICYGADQVMVVEDPAFEQFRASVYAAALKAAIARAKPDIILLSNTISVRDMAALAACELGIGLAADCQDLQMDGGGNIQEVGS